MHLASSAGSAGTNLPQFPVENAKRRFNSVMANRSPGVNDPCWCGSKSKYKFCHRDIDAARGPQRVSAARQQYVRAWTGNATNFDQQGVYQWLAKQLQPYNPIRIFDVGCGTGHGVAALLQNLSPTYLVSIDENRECLETACRNLETRSFPSTVVRRLGVEMQSEKHYAITINAQVTIPTTGTVLVEADLFCDPILEAFLKEIPQFDAVTVWLVGTHLTRQHCLNLTPLKITTNQEYRLRVQNKTYELADAILRPGGILQVVDRGEIPSTDHLKDDTLNAHKEQASVTNLVVQGFEVMPYNELERGQRVNMVQSLGTSGRRPENPEWGIISVISKKP